LIPSSTFVLVLVLVVVLLEGESITNRSTTEMPRSIIKCAPTRNEYFAVALPERDPPKGIKSYSKTRTTTRTSTKLNLARDYAEEIRGL
jgi:hypothetical protein